MLPIPPLASSVTGAAAMQRQAEEKIAQTKHAENRAKETAAAGDRFEHAVESSDAVQGIHDEDEQARQQQKKNPKRRPPFNPTPEDGETHLDLKA